MSEVVVSIVGRGGVGNAPIKKSEHVELHLVELLPGVVIRIPHPGKVHHLFDGGDLVILVLKFSCGITILS